MHKIYLLAYTLISLVLLQVIRAGNRMADKVPESRIARRERMLAKAYMAVFVAGVAGLCLFK